MLALSPSQLTAPLCARSMEPTKSEVEKET
jgi:hypothetical protein